MMVPQSIETPFEIKKALWQGRTAASAGQPPKNPHADFDLGVAWTTGYFQERGSLTADMRLQAKLAGLSR